MASDLACGLPSGFLTKGHHYTLEPSTRRWRPSPALRQRAQRASFYSHEPRFGREPIAPVSPRYPLPLPPSHTPAATPQMDRPTPRYPGATPRRHDSFQKTDQQIEPRHVGLVFKEGQLPPAAFSRSVFLLAADGADWEVEAVDALVEMGFDEGVIFVGNIETNGSSWAVRTRLLSDVIICFVPSGTGDPQARNIAWPALQWADSGKLVCGADSSGWLHDVLKLSQQMALHDTLQQTLTTAWKMVAKGATREGAEREVPLMVWRTPSWDAWYTNLKAAGNRLNGAKVNWTFRVGPGGIFVLFWAVHCNIWVESERRSKANEVVISRPDIACVLAYLPGLTMLDTEIVLIKEFRSPCRNQEMFVYELPGGSSFKPNADTFQTAADELFEETGIKVPKERLEKEMNRQAAATVTTHHVHLFSCELTTQEMETAKECARNNSTFGNFEEETERTYIETMTLRDAIPSSRMDFTTLGMVMQTIGLYFDHKTKKQMGELKGRLERLGLDTGGLENPKSSGTSPKNILVAALGSDDEDKSVADSQLSAATAVHLMSLVTEHQGKAVDLGAENNKLKEQVRAQQEEITQLKAAAAATIK